MLDGLGESTQRPVYPSNIKINEYTYIDSTSMYDKYSFTQGSLSDLSPEMVRNYNYTPHAFQLKARARDLFGTNGTNYHINQPLITYGALKTKVKPYENLFSLNYFDIPQTINITTNKVEVFGGDTFITPFSFEIANRGAGWKDFPNE
jgi:hypothetical protein